MSDLFVTATRSKFRFPSEVGDLTSEDLWQLPLTARRGASLNAVAIAVNTELRGLAEESFVGPVNDPRRRELENKLEIVKFVIATKQAEATAATNRLATQETKRKLQEAIAAKEGEALQGASIDDLRAQLAALG